MRLTIATENSLFCPDIPGHSTQLWYMSLTRLLFFISLAVARRIIRTEYMIDSYEDSGGYRMWKRRILCHKHEKYFGGHPWPHCLFKKIYQTLPQSSPCWLAQDGTITPWLVSLFLFSACRIWNGGPVKPWNPPALDRSSTDRAIVMMWLISTAVSIHLCYTSSN